MEPERSQAVLDFVVRFKAKHDGLSPSYDVIGQACGLGKTTVKHHVDQLELARGPGRWGLIVPGGRWVPPFDGLTLPEATRAVEARRIGQNPPFARQRG